MKIACLEEIAWNNGWIDDCRMLELADAFQTSPYGDYLRGLLDEKQA
jgi:glucose-1-phosphate thymidylyltransferase